MRNYLLRIVNEPSIADWLVAIGTIAIAILAVFQDKIRALITRPKLKAEISLAPPDCHKTPLRDLQTGKLIADCYYFRLRVENVGNRAAKDVEVFAASLKKKCVDGKYIPVDLFLPMNLKWSYLDKIYFPSISPEMHKHCDLGHIVDPEKRSLCKGENKDHISDNAKTLFSFDKIVPSNTREHLIEPGDYIIEVVVAAANAPPKKQKIEINHTGSWFAEEDRMLKDGIGIKCL